MSVKKIINAAQSTVINVTDQDEPSQISVKFSNSDHGRFVILDWLKIKLKFIYSGMNQRIMELSWLLWH
jgi:hypothetical protein